MLWCCTGLSKTPSYMSVASQRSGPIMNVLTFVIPIWKASSMRSICKRMYSPRGRTSFLGIFTSTLASRLLIFSMRTSMSRIISMKRTIVSRSSRASFRESVFASASTRSVTSATCFR